jgi:hypothetical protein
MRTKVHQTDICQCRKGLLTVQCPHSSHGHVVSFAIHKLYIQKLGGTHKLLISKRTLQCECAQSPVSCPCPNSSRTPRRTPLSLPTLSARSLARGNQLAKSPESSTKLCCMLISSLALKLKRRQLLQNDSLPLVDVAVAPALGNDYPFHFCS